MYSPAASGTPIVSVIVATYNWSGALRCAVQSALLQTLKNIEILVVGDACTDDSEAVVQSFGDSRVRWTNLEHHYGHQWGPNNEGLRTARSEWVAYLGHDDIWYPTHLESALRVAAEKSADLVAGATILFGPPLSGIRAITGLFRTQELKPPEWAPPSSWVHRRSLVDIAGYWTNPSELSLPADIDFMKRLLAVGARTACTNELTVFKFNAGTRDTYKIKTNTEQQELLRKVQSGTDFRHHELIDLIRAESLGMTIKIEMPSDEHPAGAVHKWHQRLKGIQPRFSNDELRTLDSLERFSITDHNGWMEWHEEEIHPTFGKFRWTGPQRRSTIDLPIRLDREFIIRIHILGALRIELLPPQLKVGLNSVPVHMERTDVGTFLLFARARPHERSDTSVSVTIELGATIRPCDLGNNPDQRRLGAMVNWIELEPG